MLKKTKLKKIKIGFLSLSLIMGNTLWCELLFSAQKKPSLCSDLFSKLGKGFDETAFSLVTYREQEAGRSEGEKTKEPKSSQARGEEQISSSSKKGDGNHIEKQRRKIRPVRGGVGEMSSVALQVEKIGNRIEQIASQGENHFTVVLLELQQQRKESEKQREATERRFQQQKEESEKQRKESNERWETLQKESIELSKKSNERWETLQKESNRLSKELKEAVDRLNKHDKNWGDLAEVSIQNTILSLMRKEARIELNKIDKNVRPPSWTKHHKRYEYDIIAWNDKTKTVVVVEVKFKFREQYVETFINGSLAEFKAIFPYFKDYTLYGAIASLKVEDNSYNLAQNSGLFTIQGSSAKAIMHLKKDFVPKEFP